MAGAINERGTGLPTAVSGHNTYWWWRPGNPHATTVVAVARGPVNGYAGYLRQNFAKVLAARSAPLVGLALLQASRSAQATGPPSMRDSAS